MLFRSEVKLRKSVKWDEQSLLTQRPYGRRGSGMKTGPLRLEQRNQSLVALRLQERRGPEGAESAF